MPHVRRLSRALDVSYLRNVPGVCGFRMTLESGVPLSTSNQTAKTNLYLTPDPQCVGFCGIVSNYESGAWIPRKRTQLTISLSGLTANTLYDVFTYDSSGTWTSNLVAWSNSTPGSAARATAIAVQDGVPVQTSNANRIFHGTMLTTGTTGQCEFSRTGIPFIGVSNFFNRRKIKVKRIETTDSWSQAATAWRAINNDATNNRVTAAFCWSDMECSFRVSAYCQPGVAARANVGVGVDSSTVNSALAGGPPYTGGTVYGDGQAFHDDHPAEGVHVFYPLEARNSGGGTLTWYGDEGSTYTQSGMTGEIQC